MVFQLNKYISIWPVLLLFAGCLLGQIAHGQGAESNNIQGKEDVHAVKEVDWDDVTDGADFFEKSEVVEREPKEQEKVKKKDSDYSFFNSNFFKYLSIFIIFILIMVVVSMVVSNNRRNVGISKDLEFSISQAEDDIEATDLQQLLDKALKNNSYKLALRIYYLILIKNMNTRGLIKYKKDKTNYTYLLEMRGNENQEAFKNITRIYEFYWYGDHDISRENYGKVSSGMEQFNNRINTSNH